MAEYRSATISDIISEMVNRDTFLPAIQREYVWTPYQIEKLFDSLMCGYQHVFVLEDSRREQEELDLL